MLVKKKIDISGCSNYMNVGYNEYVATCRIERGLDKEEQIEEYSKNERDRKG